MTSGDLILDIFEKLQGLRMLAYDLCLSNQALLAVMKDSFPRADYAKYLRDATKSELSKKTLASLRAGDEQLEQLRKAIKGMKL